MSLHQILFILHLLAAAVAIGIGFSNGLNMRIATRQTGDVARGLAMHRLAMLPVSDAALAVLLVTGGLLLWLGGSIPVNSTWFAVKLVFVAVLVVLYGLMRMTVGRLKRGGDPALAQRLMVIGPLTGISAILIVTFAVMAFEV